MCRQDVNRYLCKCILELPIFPANYCAIAESNGGPACKVRVIREIPCDRPCEACTAKKQLETARSTAIRQEDKSTPWIHQIAAQGQSQGKRPKPKLDPAAPPFAPAKASEPKAPPESRNGNAIRDPVLSKSFNEPIENYIDAVPTDGVDEDAARTYYLYCQANYLTSELQKPSTIQALLGQANLRRYGPSWPPGPVPDSPA